MSGYKKRYKKLKSEYKKLQEENKSLKDELEEIVDDRILDVSYNVVLTSPYDPYKQNIA